MVDYDNLVGEFGLDDVQEIGEDLMESQSAFLMTFFSCIFVMVLYGLFIYYLTGLIVWVSIIGTGVGVLVLSLLLNTYVNENYGAHSRVAVEESKANGEENWTAKFYQGSVYALWALIALYVICICCLYKNIKQAIQILKTSAIVLVRNLYVVLVPLLSQVCILLWIGFWLRNILYLFSTCDIQQPVAGS